jgi:predicted dehydrogenase
MTMITRRQFLEDSILATAAAVTASAAASPALARDQQSPSDNDAIGVAILGCGIRGKQHAEELGRIPGCEILAVCDPDRDRVEGLADQIAQHNNRRPKAVQDLRRIIDDPSVHAVFIATCNHWHALAAIWAMQAGKDVYVEKPVSHNIHEGRRIVEVARKTGRICQAGTQRRSSGPLAAAIDYIRQGKLGDVRLAKSIHYERRDSIGGPGKYAIPPQVDYNLWAGPAPLSPLTRPRFHYDWHWFWETGNGELGNNNIHMVDVCRWGLGVTGLGRAVISLGGRLGYVDAGQTPNTLVVIHEFDGKTIIQETRGLKSEPFFSPKSKGGEGRRKGLAGGSIFYGTKGLIAESSLFDHEGNLVRTFTGAGQNHFANFLKAVRSRKREDLNADILEGHQSTALCHAGNICYRLGRPASVEEIEQQFESVKVHPNAMETIARTRKHLSANAVDLEKTPLTLGAQLDIHPDQEAFLGNDKANALLSREYRQPFVLGW